MRNQSSRPVVGCNPQNAPVACLWLWLCRFPAVTVGFQSLCLGLVRPFCRPWKPENEPWNSGSCWVSKLTLGRYPPKIIQHTSTLFTNNRDEANRHGFGCSNLFQRFLPKIGLLLVGLRKSSASHWLDTDITDVTKFVKTLSIIADTYLIISDRYIMDLLNPR